MELHKMQPSWNM